MRLKRKPNPSRSAPPQAFQQAPAPTPKLSPAVKRGLLGRSTSRGPVRMMKDGGGVKSLEQHASMPASKAHDGLKKGGMAKMTKAEMPSKMSKVATAKPKMGSASKRADGVAMKGKTKGVMMRKGGMCK